MEGGSYVRYIEARRLDQARGHGDPQRGILQGQVEQGRYGPIFPKTPACYGFSIIAKIIPGREPVFYEYAKNIEKAVADQPDVLAVLKLHYLRWVLFDIKGETYFQYMGIFDTDFDKYTEDAVGDLRGDRSQHRLRKSGGLSEGLENKCLRHSSSSSVTIIARASLNMANIRS